LTDDERPGILRALGEPGPLVLILAAFVVAAAFHSLLGLALGAVLFGTALAIAAVVRNSAGFQSKITKARLANESSEEKWNRTHTIEKLDAESRVQMKTIVRCFDEIEEEIESMGLDGITPEFSAMTLQSKILVNRSLEMAQRRSKLLSYLIKANPEEINKRLSDIEQKIAASTQNATEDLQTSLQLCKGELNNMNDAKSVCEHILSHLENTALTLTNMRSQLVTLKTSDAQAALAARQEYSKQVNTLSASVDTLDADTTNLTRLMQ